MTIVADRVSQSVPVNVRPPTSAVTHKNLAATALVNSAKKVMVRMQRLSISKQIPTTPGNVEVSNFFRVFMSYRFQDFY